MANKYHKIVKRSIPTSLVMVHIDGPDYATKVLLSTPKDQQHAEQLVNQLRHTIGGTWANEGPLKVRVA